MTESDERRIDERDDDRAERQGAAAAVEEARRKRRRDAVFGDASTTAADADALTGERPEAEQARRDEELRRDVPPHHG